MAEYAEIKEMAIGLRDPFAAEVLRDDPFKVRIDGERLGGFRTSSQITQYEFSLKDSISQAELFEELYNRITKCTEYPSDKTEAQKTARRYLALLDIQDTSAFGEFAAKYGFVEWLNKIFLDDATIITIKNNLAAASPAIKSKMRVYLECDLSRMVNFKSLFEELKELLL